MLYVGMEKRSKRLPATNQSIIIRLEWLWASEEIYQNSLSNLLGSNTETAGCAGAAEAVLWVRKLSNRFVKFGVESKSETPFVGMAAPLPPPPSIWSKRVRTFDSFPLYDVFAELPPADGRPIDKLLLYRLEYDEFLLLSFAFASESSSVSDWITGDT